MSLELRNKKDDRAKAIENNPCGMCRAFGLPTCKGHAGGGSGSGLGDASSEQNESSFALNPANPLPAIKPADILSYLENSPVWILKDDFQFEFSNDFSVFDVEIDAARGGIQFHGHDVLNAEEEADLNALYDRIESEIMRFGEAVGAEQITFLREKNNLIIHVPNPKRLEQFAALLINKHLMPGNHDHSDWMSSAKQTIQQMPDEAMHSESSYKSPNPFDISKGPLPSDGR